MNLLLDTHVFIWLDAEPEKLSNTASALIEDRTNQLFLSVASIWEMQIKHRLGKLGLRDALTFLLQDQQEKNDLQILPILLPHTLSLDLLPSIHRDPFDRLLMAQALYERFTLLSHDEVFKRYPVPVMWK